jgi:FkbM family methyltransferase
MRALLKRAVGVLGYDLGQALPTRSLPLYLRALFTQLGIDGVLDVGAHTGEYGRQLRERGYRGQIVSFEPVPEHFAALDRAARRDPRWRVYPYALGDREGTAPLNVARVGEFSSFLEANAYGTAQFGRAIDVARTVPVAVRRLDAVLPEVTAGLGVARFFLKVDTQGFDRAVLDGASGCLGQIAALQLELSVRPIYVGMPRYTDVVAHLAGLGFAVGALFPVSYDKALHLVELDGVFVRLP